MATNLKKTKIKKLKMLSLILGVFILGAAIYILAKEHSTNSNQALTVASPGTINYSHPSKADENLENQTKQEISQNANNNISNPNYSQSTSPSSTSSISVTISRASQVDQQIEIRTIVDGASSGVCVITFSQNGQQSFNDSFPIALEATYYTCNNANIPVSNFPNNGQWQVSVIVNSGGSSSPAANSSVNVVQ